MTLREKQSSFAIAVAHLILKAAEMGYEVTLGEAWRSEHEAKRHALAGSGIRRSLHQDRLAIDLNLFRHGEWLTSTESHRPLGEYWESLSTDEYDCAWGGSWGDDGNHYSITHEGRK